MSGAGGGSFPHLELKSWMYAMTSLLARGPMTNQDGITVP